MFDKKTFQETFSQVTASEALLTEVLNMTNEKKTQSRPLGRTLLVAAVLICALTVSAVAAAGATGYRGEVADVLEGFFGNGGAYASHEGVVEYDEYGKLAINLPAWSREPMDESLARELVAPYLYTLEENTVVRDGFTYTIHAILWDSNTRACLIYWSVENPQGLGDYRVGMNGEFITTEQSHIYAVVSGRDYIDTANSTDTKLYLCGYEVDWDDELWCELGVRYDISEKADTQKLIIPRADRGGMKALHFGDTITMSPVAIRFDGIRDSVVLKELTVVYGDGSEYVVFSEEKFIDNTTYGLNSTEEYVTYTFNRIVDVDNVTAIVVNGEVYPVEGAEGK